MVNHILEISLCLIFSIARLQIFHDKLERLVRDVDGLFHQLDLVLILPHTKSSDSRSDVFDPAARIFVGKLLRFYSVVVRKILVLVAEAVEIQGGNVLSVHHAAYHSFKGIQETNILDAGDLLCLGDSDFSSEPALLGRVRLLDEKDAFLFFFRLFHQQDHMISAESGQIEKVPVCLKRQVLVRTYMKLDS